MHRIRKMHCQQFISKYIIFLTVVIVQTVIM